MSFYDYVAHNADRITFLAIQHIEVVLLSIVFATVIGVGLGVATERSPRLRRVLLLVTGTLLTIPSFALFGILIPILGLGVGPTVVALTVYAIFPILRNTVTGLESVDAAVIDAARGMGLSSRQCLRRVRLPLALPVILNGIRVATIMVVAIAAIGAAVRGPGLGELIFRGLSRIGGANALNEALSGVVGVVLVALVLDLIFLVIGRLATPRGLHV
ncbi:ABC transporter permease [Thermostaphylospora chromogena]|uniref:Osmoprotectant transport system permease protein n=1 Tax=Thermostaphylospora chromogena TaxID=35622 RepID=A0A1H1CZD4_9ACTN|nr:ABC transporter permease [Thermostaphylospora chromogena]SDQ69637.1 osmoprotectant transport system permease protein [Thermostaphylospora chromogena]